MSTAKFAPTRYTLDEIETFLAVMELGAIIAAARMNLSKPVISKRISDLELTLGAALFRCNAGRITSTEAARGFDDRLRLALADLTSAAESAAWGGWGDDNLRGTLSITAPMSFGTLYLSPTGTRLGKNRRERRGRGPDRPYQTHDAPPRKIMKSVISF